MNEEEKRYNSIEVKEGALLDLITEWRQALADKVAAIEKKGHSGTTVYARNGQSDAPNLRTSAE